METETQTENSIVHNTDDEICVDQIEMAGNYFDIETGRPQSLDKVIVQSIERLRKFKNYIKWKLTLLDVTIGF